MTTPDRGAEQGLEPKSQKPCKYAPCDLVKRMKGLEPSTFCMTSRHLKASCAARGAGGRGLVKMPSADTSFPRCGFGGASRELLALARKHERAGGRVSVPTRLKHARVTRRRRQAEGRFGPAGSSALARRRSCDCAELLCGCALPCAGVAPVAAGGEPTMARERAGERVFGAVADGGRDRGDDVVGVLLLDAAWEPVVGDHAGAVA